MSRSIIAIASGKGGTGKTTVATNLAVSAARAVRRVHLLDCDVEAPNVHLFMRPKIVTREKVDVPVPQVDPARCDGCGECGRFCRFNAIVALKTKPLVFPELCHGCGGCLLVCPAQAITEQYREVGEIETGRAEKVCFTGGRLRIGEAMSPPLIRAVKKRMTDEGLVIIDAPPGTTCSMIEAVRHADRVLLVTEPTPFGLSDLSIAVDAMRKLEQPFGIVVNRAVPGRDMIRRFAEEEGIEMLAELPDDRRVAEAYSQGVLAVDAVESFRPLFKRLLGDMEKKTRPSAMTGTLYR